MEHNISHHMSLALLVSVAITAGQSAPLHGEESRGILRLTARTLPDDPPFQCIAASQFTIAGLRLHDDAAALAPLGAPRSLTRGSGVDDGGDYVVATYHYDGLEVDMVRGHIDRIEARSPVWPTPAGLRTGMERAAALALLGRVPDPDHLREETWSFSGCPEWRDGELVWDNTNNYFEFAFGPQGDLGFIRLVADRP